MPSYLRAQHLAYVTRAVPDDRPEASAGRACSAPSSTGPTSPFGCVEDAQAHCRQFFAWCNGEHGHSGIGFHTRADVHDGRAVAVGQQRAGVLDAANAADLERFVDKPPRPPALPTTAWINKRKEDAATTQ